MKVRAVKARKALGFAAQIELMGLQFKKMDLALQKDLCGKDTPESVLEELERIKRTEREIELYKKPGFYKDRRIKIVDSLPRRPRSEIIYISFNETGYEIKSGRNFIHTPIISYGNLRYAGVDLEHLITDEERSSVSDNLVSLNNGRSM